MVEFFCAKLIGFNIFMAISNIDLKFGVRLQKFVESLKKNFFLVGGSPPPPDTHHTHTQTHAGYVFYGWRLT